MKNNNSSKYSKKLSSPVLFLVFNRLQATKRVFAEIRKAAPKKLFIAADGYRVNVTGEKKECEEVKKYILNNIDWKCEVKTLFRNKNLGCGKSVAKAITWFFKNVKEGIILEDDCLPDQSFFYFCEELLTHYRQNHKIFMISGDNFAPESLNKIDSSYYFSNTPYIWGWATWRRAWKKFNFDIDDSPKFIENQIMDSVWGNQKIKRYWQNIISDARRTNIDTWCWKWAYAIWKNHGICITSNRNLVSNIGLNSTGTHTLHGHYKELSPPKKTCAFPLSHPEEISINKEADDFVNKNIFLKKSTLKSILKKMGLFNFVKKIYIKIIN